MPVNVSPVGISVGIKLIFYHRLGRERFWTCPGTTDTRTLRTIDPQKEVLSARGNATVSARV